MKKPTTVNRETPTNAQSCRPYTALVLRNSLVKAGVPKDQIHLKNNWYYVSGFIDFTRQGGGIVYFCTFDYRDRSGGAYVRKAKSLQDYTGGRNRHGKVHQIVKMVLDCRDAREPGF